MTMPRRKFLALGIALFSATAFAAPPVKRGVADWKQVAQTVDAYFAKTRGRQPMDIITRNEVSPLFDQLAKQGWQVAERKEILDRVPADNEFMVKQLRSQKGRAFMRQISQYPGGYDSLDRLSKLPQGKNTVEALIKGPDGFKMLQYMDTTQGGLNLEKQLAHTPKGKDFTKPTGRIYTVGELKWALRNAYAGATQPATSNSGR
jgi:hypothetical protein